VPQDVANHPLLRRLARIPKSVALLGTLALLVVALLLPHPYSGILLLALAAALAALLATTWPVQPPATRGLRGRPRPAHRRGADPPALIRPSTGGMHLCVFDNRSHFQRELTPC
jgi:hypothetical protein